MALSRMVKLGEIVNIVRCTTVKSNFSKDIRNFKRLRVENPKPNLDNPTTPFQNTGIGAGNITISKLWKPFLFTVGFTTASFTGVAIWQYESLRAHVVTMRKQPLGFARKKTEEAQQQADMLIKHVKKWWNQLTPGEKVFVPIFVINVLVFAAWRIPALQPTMLKYFCSNPGSRNLCWPMLLSTFSHYSLFHLLANMYVLHSFSTGAVASLGKEQFLGLYLSAGVISSFTSYLFKAVTKQPGLSLGASGAIMAILGYVCTQYPETKLGIIFLPMLTFSAGAAIKVIVGLDTAGVLFGWKFFDHAAHLGGAATGIAWSLWGNEYLWQKRDPVLQYWHHVRGAIK